MFICIIYIYITYIYSTNQNEIFNIFFFFLEFNTNFFAFKRNRKLTVSSKITKTITALISKFSGRKIFKFCHSQLFVTFSQSDIYY